MDPLFRLTRAPAVSLGALVASAAELQTGIPLAGNGIDTLAKQLRGLTFLDDVENGSAVDLMTAAPVPPVAATTRERLCVTACATHTPLLWSNKSADAPAKIHHICVKLCGAFLSHWTLCLDCSATQLSPGPERMPARASATLPRGLSPLKLPPHFWQGSLLTSPQISRHRFAVCRSVLLHSPLLLALLLTLIGQPQHTRSSIVSITVICGNFTRQHVFLLPAVWLTLLWPTVLPD